MEATREVLGLTWAELATLCGVSRKTVLDWRREVSRIRHEALLRLAELSNLPLPHIREIIVEEDWHRRAGKLGAKKSRELYGNPGTIEGRSKGGKVAGQRRQEHPELYTGATTAKPIREPELSPPLAELVGILLGDGQLTTYNVAVVLNLRHEREYADWVANLFHDLFGVEPIIHTRVSKTTFTVNVASSRLVAYLSRLGLLCGNKVAQQIRVPAWIFEQDVWRRACVRGLMDTDGGPYPHIYRVNGKTYQYVKLNFSNHSLPLLADMKILLEGLGFSPTSDNKTKVILSRQNDLARYYTEVGTHNPYHLERLRQFSSEPIK